ncbi:universal stress protein [Motiliproteus sp. SC1-56]|uniref:universal stress protein n=1 Tax=Motiliproteus sp. SC1-56 TaxID=2799565 RepID=UPI001A8C3598|nr:universal stress protein [Motiliproteus sp. SC1-56]
MFKKILIPVDLEEPQFSDRAIALGLREVDREGGDIHLMTVIPGFSSPLVASYFKRSDVKKAHEAVDQHLIDFAHEKIPADVHRTLSVHQGNPAERIIKQAKRLGADLIIMTAHHRGKVDHVLLGSNSQRVVDRAPCSVLVLRS